VFEPSDTDRLDREAGEPDERCRNAAIDPHVRKVTPSGERVAGISDPIANDDVVLGAVGLHGTVRATPGHTAVNQRLQRRGRECSRGIGVRRDDDSDDGAVGASPTSA